MMRLISRYYDEELAAGLLAKGVDLHVLAILAALAISILFWGYIPGHLIFGWLAALTVIEGVLIAVVSLNKRPPEATRNTRVWLVIFGVLHVSVSITWGSFALIAVEHLDVWQCMIVLALLYLVLATPYNRLIRFYPIFAMGIIAKSIIVLGSLTFNIEYEWRYILSIAFFTVAVIALLIRGKQDALIAVRAHKCDKLTGLPNKKAFEFEAIRKTARQSSYGIISINLRQQGKLGYAGRSAAWEAAILQIAEKLRLFIKEENYIARYSEQYFTVVIFGHHGQYYADEASRMLRIIGDGVRFEDDFIPFEISAGIAVYPQDAGSFQAVLEKSQLAANLPPDFDGEKVVRYQPKVDAMLNRADEIKNEIDRAIAAHEFSLYYQPKINLQSGRPIGAEALIRWKNAKLGRVGPGEFIPIAEESGHIIELGEWVIQQAARDLRTLNSQHNFSIAVNVSIAQFASGELLRCFNEAVQGLPENKSLEVEITESIIMNDPEIIRQRLKEFASLGIKVALDDFGTGYSSLRYITELAINKIKIDQSFIRKIPADPIQNAIVQAIVSLSRAFNVEVIAEGVETEEQVNSLKTWQCDTVQGYYYGKPMPLAEFNHWLEERTHVTD